MKFRIRWSAPAFESHSTGPGQPLNRSASGQLEIDAENETEARQKARRIIGPGRNIYSVTKTK